MNMLNAHTKLCAVIGNPVEHSLSPAIHNAAFQKLGLNYVYLAFRVEDVPNAIKGMRAFENMRGFSVTIPHKVAVIPYLDEIETTARHIGSVNTIVIDRGKLSGYNTDASGALRALKEAEVDLKDRRILILGSGGAARAIAFGLSDVGIERLTILGIEDHERGRLADDLRSQTSLTVEDGTIDDATLRETMQNTDIMIHCTPLGMSPNVDRTCIPAALLRPSLTVMDIVYNPLETRLLREARAAGCTTIRGIEMFLNQAVAQFELWTKQPAPSDVMRTVLESHWNRS